MKIYTLNLNLFWQCRIQMMFLISLFIPHGNAVAALEFFSMAENAVIMYNAPSLKADKLYVASRYLPVESVVRVEGWTKVRDSSGALAWVEQRALSDKRFLIVTAIKADIYQAADLNSVLVFQAQQNVVLEWLESTANGWIKVRHQDGQSGYVRILQVWGS
ncbi:MAG: SH3 domain-containing protein [Nitrosospira sp.]|nr:SH3 domain-containing protein [Nitrosospira sp.]MBI0416292.1 SH3 domain-containing protein [Nitrosospira sp.]MBI0419981.1 SH3 domain-containing protein [Nitrosospira sp.]